MPFMHSDVPLSGRALHLEETPPPQTVIGSGITVEGDIIADGTVVVCGRVDGALVTQGCVFVAPMGRVGGTLEAEQARVAGCVNGDLRVQDMLVLTASARVRGAIDSARLAVEEGAQLVGRCSIAVSAAKAASAKVAVDEARF
jgi:cytoskeletal protein CcmA (bactofilin family)